MMSKIIDTLLCSVVDKYFATYSRKLQSNSAPKIVAHRGIYDNVSVFENTIEAFEKALRSGVWGIEFDVQWTCDGHPVVIHDDNCWRVFNADININEVTLQQLHRQVPFVPTLSEVIERYGKKLHLMIEVKYKDHYIELLLNLSQYFKCLEPCEDFHILALDVRTFGYVDSITRQAFLPVAEKNITQLSAIALKNGYGGLTGHYVLLNKRITIEHKCANQSIGTGFISSRNCLVREMNRGVDWIFTNHAEKIQNIANTLYFSERRQ